MKMQPNWRIALILYVLYNLIIFGTWWAVGSDYNNMIGPEVAFQRLVLPLALGFVFLVVVLSGLGWWEPVMRDENRAAPTWAQWPIILVAIAFIGLVMSAAAWSSLAAGHLSVLIAAGILVGFNEEALARGVLVVGLCDGGRSEAWVWFASSLLFGLMHLPNGFFGLDFGSASVQVLFAFVMGGGFYVLRRLSGTIVLPMVVHGFWDFASFAHLASGADNPEGKTEVQIAAYGVAIVCTVILLWAMRGRRADAAV